MMNIRSNILACGNEQHKGVGHRQRLREKFLTSGLSGFHDYEVIELLLTLGTPRKDCKEAAKKAIKRFAYGLNSPNFSNHRVKTIFLNASIILYLIDLTA